MLGPAHVASGDVTADPAAAVSQWLHGATLADLKTDGVVIENHAELFERGEAARWHWILVRDRLGDPDDTLAASRPLLERLLERELPTRFFSFTSHYQLCFAASSHYP